MTPLRINLKYKQLTRNESGAVGSGNTSGQNNLKNSFIESQAGQVSDVRFQLMDNQENSNFKGYESQEKDGLRQGTHQKATRDDLKNAFDNIKRGISSVEENQQIALQHKNAKEYAQKNGLWIESLYDLGEDTDKGGMENKIAANPDEGMIYKSNNLFAKVGSILRCINTS
jgi:hypothetical protein